MVNSRPRTTLRNKHVKLCITLHDPTLNKLQRRDVKVKNEGQTRVKPREGYIVLWNITWSQAGCRPLPRKKRQ